MAQIEALMVAAPLVPERSVVECDGLDVVPRDRGRVPENAAVIDGQSVVQYLEGAPVALKAARRFDQPETAATTNMSPAPIISR